MATTKDIDWPGDGSGHAVMDKGQENSYCHGTGQMGDDERSEGWYLGRWRLLTAWMTMDRIGLDSTQEAPISGIVLWLWETCAIGND